MLYNPCSLFFVQSLVFMIQKFIIFVSLYIKGVVSSVGSERMLHTHEVTGSNPVQPTRNESLAQLV